MRVVVMSDTHIPARARTLPERLWADVERSDVVVHAGDWIEAQLLRELVERAPMVIGCYGNNDGPELRRLLPEVARHDLDGLRLVVVHETGPAKGREARLERLYPDADVVFFGHSHIPWDSTTPGGIRLLNPGSPTDKRRQPSATYLSAEISGGRLNRVELHELA